MSEMAVNCMDHWDSGTRLEYLKMCLRTSVGKVTKFYNNKLNCEMETIHRDINWRRKFLPRYAH